MKVTSKILNDDKLIFLLIQSEQLLYAISLGFRYDHLQGGHQNFVSNVKIRHQRLMELLSEM